MYIEQTYSCFSSLLESSFYAPLLIRLPPFRSTMPNTRPKTEVAESGIVSYPHQRSFTAQIAQTPPQQLERLVLGRAQLELAPCVMRHEPHVCRYAAQAAARLCTSKLGQP